MSPRGVLDECLYSAGLLMDDCSVYGMPPQYEEAPHECYGSADSQDFAQHSQPQDFYALSHPADPPQTQQRSSPRKAASNNAKKRGIFPKQATNILRAWLFQHLTVGHSLSSLLC